MAGLALFLAFGFAYPKYTEISDYRQVLSQHQGALEEKKQIFAAIAKIQEEYAKYENDINRLSVLVPKEKDAQEIVSAVSAIAQNSGLQLKSIKVSAIKSDAEKDDKNKVIIDASLSGSYPSLVSFLQGVEKSLRIIDVKEASLKEDFGSSLNIQLKMEAYFLK